MLSVKEKLIFFLPILLALVVGVAAFILIAVKSISGTRMLIGLLAWGLLSSLMFVFTFSYLFGPDCVYCYDPPKIRLATEYLIGVIIFGLIGAAISWAVRRA